MSAKAQALGASFTVFPGAFLAGLSWKWNRKRVNLLCHNAHLLHSSPHLAGRKKVLLVMNLGSEKSERKQNRWEFSEALSALHLRGEHGHGSQSRRGWAVSQGDSWASISRAVGLWRLRSYVVGAWVCGSMLRIPALGRAVPTHRALRKPTSCLVTNQTCWSYEPSSEEATFLGVI